MIGFVEIQVLLRRKFHQLPILWKIGGQKVHPQLGQDVDVDVVRKVLIILSF